MFKPYLLVLLLFFVNNTFGQTEVLIQSNDVTLYGTLQEPDKVSDIVVFIITGSGETDRNGNTLKVGYVNNCLKLLAEDLSANGIASLRYDKRGVGKSTSESLLAENLRFEQYINDAQNWIRFLKTKYKTVIVAGHSQGALVGMVAIQKESVDKFIIISGMTENTITTIKKQLSTQPAFVLADALPILDSLQKGVRVDSVPEYLNSLFHPKTQNYFMSLVKYDPQEEIQKINIPTLIIQGTNDIQISLESAKALAVKGKNIELITIGGMNHILKLSKLDVNENMATYSNPNLALHNDLIPTIITFIKNK